MTDYAPATWHPSPYYGARLTNPPTLVVLHDTNQPPDQAFAQLITFLQGDAEASVHYCISKTGQVVQMVAESNNAWGAGNEEYNLAAINIEHEMSRDDPAGTFSDAMLTASAKLVADICRRCHIAPVHSGASPGALGTIIGHIDVPDPFHAGQWGGADHHIDPRGFPWPRYMQMVAGYLAPVPAPQPIPPNPSSGVRAADWVKGWLATDGYPIADPQQEVLGDGKTYTTQYYQRARFQLNPDQTVGRGLVGAELYQLKYHK